MVVGEIFNKMSRQRKRILKHWRYGRIFAWINRNLRSRRKAIKAVRLLYKQYGLIDKGCTFCKGKSFTLIAQGDRYGFDLDKQLCNQCGLMQTYPALSPEFHKEFYSQYYRPLYLGTQIVDYQLLIKEQTIKGKKYLNYFHQHGLKPLLKDLSVIEIGCSSGGTLAALKRFVRSVQGCDLDAKAVKFSQNSFNLNTEVSMYPSSLPPKKRLFILSHVLEHVFNPLETLTVLRKLSEKEDYLFIAVPGMNMVTKGSYKNDLRRYFHIAHATDFTESTLRCIAQTAGFNPLATDEEVNGLFLAGDSKAIDGCKNCKEDWIVNILNIEKTYSGWFPHL